MRTLDGILAPIVSRLSFPLLKAQVLRIWPAVRVSLVLCLGGVGATVLVAILMDAKISRLVRDPSEVMHYPAYIGMLSNWGIMLWTACATICLFDARILRQHNGSPKSWQFLLASGALSLYLGLDDLFRLHDKIFPRLLHIPETAFYFLYLAVMLAYLVYFLPQILQHEFLLLALSAGIFLVSRRNLVSFLWYAESPTLGAILKYFGIVFWLVFFYRTVINEISSLLKAQQT